MKKLLAIILALIMIVACFAGCAGGGSESSSVDSSKADDSQAESKNDDSDSSSDDLGISKDGTLPLVADKVDDMTMTILVGTTDKDPSDMWFFNYYSEITNVDWQVTPILQTDWGEKKTVIMGSGDYTDVYWGNASFTTGEIYEYGTTGIFLDLSKYYDYAPDYLAAMDMVEGSWAYVTTPDGANYTMAYVDPAFAYADNGSELWLRTQFLEDAGYDFSDDGYVITLDELHSILSDVHEDTGYYLTGMLTDDTYSFRRGMLNAFGFRTDGDYANNTAIFNDEPVFVPLTERYKEYLTYMNKLYTEGLIDPDIFTQDDTQLKAKTSEGASAGWIHSVPFIMDLDRNMEYTVYPVAYDENSDPIKYIGSSVIQGKWEITDTCKHPELAMAWINLFYKPEYGYDIMYGPLVTEDASGERTVHYGGFDSPEAALEITGVVKFDENGDYDNWSTPTYTEKYTEEYTAWDWYCLEKPVNSAYNSTLGEGYILGNMWGYPYTYEDTLAENEKRVADPTDQNEGWWRLNNMLYDWKWAQTGYPVVYLSDEYQEWIDANATLLNDYVYQMEAKFITGAASIEADYDSFLAELEKLGASKYQDIYVEVYPE